MTFDRAVFVPALLALLALVGYAGLFPDSSEQTFLDLQAGIVEYASWYYVLVVAMENRQEKSRFLRMALPG